MIGVIGNTRLVEDRFTAQLVGESNLRAVADVPGALPLMFAGTPEITDIGALLEAVDGILLTGGRANVHPSQFGAEPTPNMSPTTRGAMRWRWPWSGLRRARRAAVRHLPRLSGDERGVRQHAAPGNP